MGMTRQTCRKMNFPISFVPNAIVAEFDQWITDSITVFTESFLFASQIRSTNAQELLRKQLCIPLQEKHVSVFLPGKMKKTALTEAPPAASADPPHQHHVAH